MAMTFAKRCRTERALHEAIADYLAARGIGVEASEFTDLIATLGPPLPANSDVHWRKELARIRDELNKPDGPDYAFLLDHLIEVCTGANVPTSLCRELFGSKLFLHIVVERLATVFHGHDAELFKLESDVLCRGGGVYGICRLLLDRHFKGEEATTPISKFLRDFQTMFDDDDPKARWDEIFAIHQLTLVAFRRDLKRVLWGIDHHVLGPPKLVRLFEHEVNDDASVEPPKKRIARAVLEQQFRGSASDWRALSAVHSIQMPRDDTQQEDALSLQDDDEPIEVEDADADADVDDLETSQELPTLQVVQRVWSARLPFSTAGTAAAATGSSTESRTPEDDDDVDVEVDVDDSDSIDDDKLDDSGDVIDASSSREQPSAAALETESSASESAVDAREPAQPATESAQDETVAPPSVAPSEVSDSAADEPLVVRTKRKRWSQHEVDALLRGYREFSAMPNVWVMIKGKYADALRQRSNIDLKDKYRNLLKYNKLTPSTSTSNDGDGDVEGDGGDD